MSEAATPHLLIVPSGWQARPTGIEALRQVLYLEWGATFTCQHATTYVRAPVPLFSGTWPAGVDARLAPLIERAFSAADYSEVP